MQNTCMQPHNIYFPWHMQTVVLKDSARQSLENKWTRKDHGKWSVFRVPESKWVCVPKKIPNPCFFFLFAFSPKDSMGEFNLSKTDLNIFPLPSAVCGHQHRLQEPEERGSWLLKVLQDTPGEQSFAVTTLMWNVFLFPQSYLMLHYGSSDLTPVTLWTKVNKDHKTEGWLFIVWSYTFFIYI